MGEDMTDGARTWPLDAAPPAMRPTTIRYRVLFAACSVAVLVYIHRVGFASVLPQITGVFDLNDQAKGWLMAAFLLAYGGFEIPCGLLGDRLGVRHLLTLLVLGWSVMTGCVALVTYVPNLWMLPFIFLVAIRFLFGMFQAGAFPSLSRMLTDWMPVHQRASAQGLVWMSTRVGGVIAPLLVGQLIIWCHSWQLALVLVALLGAGWCAIFWPWFRNRPEDMPAANSAERTLIALGRDARAPTRHTAIPWQKLLRSRSVWALCLMYGFGGLAANFYVTLLPTYLKGAKHRALSSETADLLTSLPFAFGLTSCLLGGLLSDWIIRRTGNRKWGRRLQGTIGMTVGALAWLLINSAHETWMLAVVLCVIFFCNDISMAPAWASCADIAEGYAGTLGGAMNMTGNIFGALGSILVGYLFNGGRSEMVFTIFACSFACAALCWLFVDVTRPLEQHAEAA